MEQKEFKTIDEQLEILKSRGLYFSTDESTKRYLEKENYYNIINGYKDLFLETRKTSTTDEIYKDKAEFSEIKALYEFDFELKSIILKRILRVENTIKAIIAYKFSQKYGHDNYMKMDNFHYKQGDAKSIKYVMDLITGVQGIIAKQVDKHESIKHYMIEYGYVPLWVLVNILPLGTISKFYSLMKQTDKQSISKEFKLTDAELVNILKNLTYCRNKCAHGERLYNFKSSAEIRANDIHKKLSIEKENGKLAQGTKDLLSVVISLKLLLSNKDFTKMIIEINNEIFNLRKELKVISINDVYKEMGFVENWLDISKD